MTSKPNGIPLPLVRHIISAVTGKALILVPMLLAAALHGETTSPKTGSVKEEAKAAQVRRELMDAASAGTPLPATITVSDNVNIEAVMLPHDVVKRVFGKEVANSYAVIEINVSNRSNDAALILQSVFIDISEWALANPGDLLGGTGGLVRGSSAKGYQAKASTNEVVSVEYRIVRGQVQDGQMWTARSWTNRAALTMGMIGTAFAFPFSTDVIKGIGAWNGSVVPGLDKFWPDGIEAQLNRISDYGFRNNKVIPQQSADIVVAFFPINRFLIPALRKQFQQSPAMFFSPFQMLLDPKTVADLEPILVQVMGSKDALHCGKGELARAMMALDPSKIQQLKANLAADDEQIKAALAKAEEAQDQVDHDMALVQQDADATARDAGREQTHRSALTRDAALLNERHLKLQRARQLRDDHSKELESTYSPVKANPFYRALNLISLNAVHITLSGIMTVDELAVPPTIESTCFEIADAEMWAIGGDKTCRIKGRFLQDGVPKITTAGDLGITGITPNVDSSSPNSLQFGFKLRSGLDSPVQFDLLVTKAGKNGKSVESMKFSAKSSFSLPAPTIGSIDEPTLGTTATISGSGFYSTPNNPFVASLRKTGADGKASDIDVVNEAPSRSTTFDFDTSKIDATKIGPGCYPLVVKVGTASAVSVDKVRINATPQISHAKITPDKKSLSITGTELIDTKDCNGAVLAFDLLDGTGKVLDSVLPATSASGGTTVELTLTAAAPAGKVTHVRVRDATSEPVDVEAQ